MKLKAQSLKLHRNSNAQAPVCHSRRVAGIGFGALDLGLLLSFKLSLLSFS
jgi:hypothetical protein